MKKCVAQLRQMERSLTNNKMDIGYMADAAENHSEFVAWQDAGCPEWGAEGDWSEDAAQGDWSEEAGQLAAFGKGKGGKGKGKSGKGKGKGKGKDGGKGVGQRNRQRQRQRWRKRKRMELCSCTADWRRKRSRRPYVLQLLGVGPDWQRLPNS